MNSDVTICECNMGQIGLGSGHVALDASPRGCTGHGADRLAGVPASGLSAAVRGEWHCRHRDSFLTVANWSHTAVARAEHVVDDRPENQAVGLSPHLQAAVALVERMGDPGIARIRNRLLWKRHGRNLVSAKESTSVAALVLDSKISAWQPAQCDSPTNGAGAGSSGWADR